MLATPDTRSQVPRRCFEGPPSGITDAAHSKCAQIGANRTIPSPSPAHIGPRALPRPGTNRDDGSQERGQGAGPKRSVHAVRREAVTAQIQAFGSLFCAAQSRPRPGLRLRITSPVYGEVFRSLRPSLSQRHTRTGMHANRVHRHEAKMLHSPMAKSVWCALQTVSIDTLPVLKFLLCHGHLPGMFFSGLRPLICHASRPPHRARPSRP